jgi:hypothetical protein
VRLKILTCQTVNYSARFTRQAELLPAMHNARRDYNRTESNSTAEEHELGAGKHLKAGTVLKVV